MPRFCTGSTLAEVERPDARRGSSFTLATLVDERDDKV